MHILFVCSRNQWRSPTAEAIYKNHGHLQVRSAGTEPSARIKLSSADIIWADIIFVMEKKHQQRMLANFRSEMVGKRVVILDIPDEYQYMDEELIQEIKMGVEPHLSQYDSSL